jgi:hypothetical protein
MRAAIGRGDTQKLSACIWTDSRRVADVSFLVGLRFAVYWRDKQDSPSEALLGQKAEGTVFHSFIWLLLYKKLLDLQDES